MSRRNNPPQADSSLSQQSDASSNWQQFLHRGRADSRGQLVLVAAFAVAFALIGLVLLLNTALYTENIATRGPDPGTDRARDYAESVRQSVGEAIAQENHVEYANDGEAVLNTKKSIKATSSLLGRQFMKKHGVTTGIAIQDTRSGRVIEQSSRRNFTSGGSTPGETSWTLTTTRGVRDFTTTVHAESLATDSLPIADRFQLIVDGSNGNVWKARVADTIDGSNRVVVRIIYNGNQIEKCTSDDGTATIEWMNGTMEGSNCNFTFADGLSKPYTIRYKNGDKAEGSYHFVVSDSGGSESVNTDQFYSAKTSENPRVSYGVYSVTVEAVMHGDHLDYKTRIRVAPGENEVSAP